MFRNIHWNPLIGFSIHTKNLWNQEGKEPWFFFLNHFPHNETCSSRSTNHIFLSLKNCMLLTFILTWRCVPREGSTRQFGGLSLNAFSCVLPNTSWKFFRLFTSAIYEYRYLIKTYFRQLACNSKTTKEKSKTVHLHFFDYFHDIKLEICDG